MKTIVGGDEGPAATEVLLATAMELLLQLIKADDAVCAETLLSPNGVAILLVLLGSPSSGSQVRQQCAFLLRHYVNAGASACCIACCQMVIHTLLVLCQWLRCAGMHVRVLRACQRRCLFAMHAADVAVMRLGLYIQLGVSAVYGFSGSSRTHLYGCPSVSPLCPQVFESGCWHMARSMRCHLCCTTRSLAVTCCMCRSEPRPVQGS